MHADVKYHFILDDEEPVSVKISSTLKGEIVVGKFAIVLPCFRLKNTRCCSFFLSAVVQLCSFWKKMLNVASFSVRKAYPTCLNCAPVLEICDSADAGFY